MNTFDTPRIYYTQKIIKEIWIKRCKIRYMKILFRFYQWWVKKRT